MNDANRQDQLEKLLGTGDTKRRIRPAWLIAAVVALALVAAAAHFLLRNGSGAAAARYVTAPVTRG